MTRARFPGAVEWSEFVISMSAFAHRCELTWCVAAEPGHCQRGGDIAAGEEDAEGYVAADVLSHCDDDDQADQAGD